MHSLQGLRSPLLDIFFRWLHFFDTEQFSFLIIPVVWYGIRMRWGIRIGYLLMLSTLVNHDLKALFAQPRPIDFFPHFGLVETTGFGLPSGGAQAAVIVFGMLAMMSKYRYRWHLALFMIVLIGFSRVYIGVHYPSDVLGGWITGFTLLWVYHRFGASLEALPKRTLLILSVCIPALLMPVYFSKSTLKLTSVAMGLSLGLILLSTYRFFPKDPTKWHSRIIRVLITVTGLFVISHGMNTLLKGLPLDSALTYTYLIIQYVALGFWLSAGASFVNYRFGYKPKRF